jgi:asparagine synthase (glutamine-hydrolysing)
MIAKKFRVRHDKVMVRPEDFLEKLPSALDALDTPSGDGLNTYVVSQAIKNSGITVALSGIGGDELFAGYPIFDQFYRLQQRRRTFERLYGPRALLARMMPASDQRRERISSLLAARSAGIADIYPIFRQIQTPQAIRRLVKNDLFSREDGRTLERELTSRQCAIEEFESLSQVSIAEYLGYTQSVLLKDADQMGMAASLEIREPFFDHDLVEYVLNIPDAIKYPSYPKKLLVESMGDLLPGEIVHRKKQGFVLPYDLWTRNELRSFCDEKVHNLAQRGYFSEKELLQYWNNYLCGRSNIRWADIWIFIVLENWLEKHGIV